MKFQKKELILLIGSNIWYLGSGLFGPLLAVFSEKIGGNVLDISYAWATFLISTGIAIMIVGKFSDRHKYKERLLVIGYLLNTLFTFLLLTVHTPFALVLNQIGFGLALALSTPTWQALYAQHQDNKTPGMTWAWYGGGAAIIQGIAILIGGVIVQFTSFEVLFIVMGCLQLLATGFIAQILKK